MSSRSAHVKKKGTNRKKKEAAAENSTNSINFNAGSSATFLVIRLVIASVVFAVSQILELSPLIGTALLVISAFVAGYDIIITALKTVEEGNFFATPIVVLFVTIISFVIGFGVEGAALIILYQIGILIIDYSDDRTRKSALEMIQYQDEELAARVADAIEYEDTAYMRIESSTGYSAGFILNLAMIFALIYAIILPLVTSYSYSVSIHRALMMILVSTPMSVVVAMPLVGVWGLCFSAQQGVAFENARTMEEYAKIKTAVFDKAGVFTEDNPRLIYIQTDVIDKETFMNFAAHSMYYSEQPFAKAISLAYDQDYKLEVISDFSDIPGCGVELKIGGAPVRFATAEYFASKGVLIPAEQNHEPGQLYYYMTVADKYIGKAVVSSNINTDSLELVEAMKGTGVSRCVLLTEDENTKSQRIAEEFGFNEVYGGCDTVKKLKLIDDLSQSINNTMMYVYANGFEAHSSADIDVRIGKKGKYADALVAPDRILNIVFARQIAARMHQVATANAIFAFVMKAILIFLSIIGYCNIWFAIFIDMATAVLTILNSSSVTRESFLSKFMYKIGK